MLFGSLNQAGMLAGFVGAGGRDDDGLCVEELAHTGGGELAAIAGVLDAAEGEARVAGDHGIEEDCPALEPGDEALLFRRVASPGGGAEAEGSIVGEGDGLVEVLHAEEHGDGAEELFAIDGGGAGHAGEDGGLEVVAFADHALAAGEDACAGACRGLHLGLQLVDDARRCEGADVGVILHGVADAHGLHAGDEARFEGVVDLVGDDEALGGDAGLAAVDAARLDGGLDGEVEVGGRHDDEGVAAAEFEDGFFDEPAGLCSDGAACRLAAGDCDGCDALIAKDGFDLAGFDEESLKGASGKAGAAYQ